MVDEINLEILSSHNRLLGNLQKKIEEVEKKQAELKSHEELQARQIKGQVAVAMINSSGYDSKSFKAIIKDVLGK